MVSSLLQNDKCQCPPGSHLEGNTCVCNFQGMPRRGYGCDNIDNNWYVAKADAGARRPCPHLTRALFFSVPPYPHLRLPSNNWVDECLEDVIPPDFTLNLPVSNPCWISNATAAERWVSKYVTAVDDCQTTNLTFGPGEQSFPILKSKSCFSWILGWVTSRPHTLRARGLLLLQGYQRRPDETPLSCPRSQWQV